MRWHGKLGFENVAEEGDNGIFTPIITEKDYSGDQSTFRSIYRSDKPNGTITTNTTISVLVNPWLNANYNRIAYATIRGVKWAVTDVDLTDCRRIVLTLGGVYNDKVRVTSEIQEPTNSGGGSDEWWNS